MSETALHIRYLEFIRRTGRPDTSDSVNEFVHTEILRLLSRSNPFDLILHGGCKTRYIDGSPRYSMDMDFSARQFFDFSKPEMEELVKQTTTTLLHQLQQLGITLEHARDRWHRGESGVKICLKANHLKELFPAQFANRPGDINLNIDIDSLLPGESIKTNTLISDPSVRILVLDDSTHMARKASAVLLRNQLRDLYDLDLYITRGIQYDLPLVAARLNIPDLSHPILVEKLCQKVESLDLQARAHQLHLPTQVDQTAFLNKTTRIATLKQMLPIPTTK
jgi:hypothetical protein